MLGAIKGTTRGTTMLRTTLLTAVVALVTGFAGCGPEMGERENVTAT